MGVCCMTSPGSEGGAIHRSDATPLWGKLAERDSPMSERALVWGGAPVGRCVVCWSGGTSVRVYLIGGVTSD